jgi:hypothetical protein
MVAYLQMKNIGQSRRTRWLVVCLLAAILTGIQTAQSLSAGKTVVAGIYFVLTVIFLVIAFAYQRGYLK